MYVVNELDESWQKSEIGKLVPYRRTCPVPWSGGGRDRKSEILCCLVSKPKPQPPKPLNSSTSKLYKPYKLLLHCITASQKNQQHVGKFAFVSA